MSLKDKLEKAKPTQFFDDDVVEWWKEQRKLKMTVEEIEKIECPYLMLRENSEPICRFKGCVCYPECEEREEA